jgi:cytochrome o ubiquinol oxidase subunit III
VSTRDLPQSGLVGSLTQAVTPPEAQRAAFGFWLFLMSDAVIFALLFATYQAMLNATVGAPTPAREFKMGSAFLETLMLLSSSFTFGMASLSIKYRAERDDLRSTLLWMGTTLALGAAFLGLELHDFATMFGDGAYPSRSGFLSAFFALVPLHGLHVLGGSLWLIVMMIQLWVLGCDSRVRLNLMRLGLFWHFLDIVWIAIFSVVYLQGLIR